MIDLHTHVLPGIDDGASDIAESLRICRAASRDGTEIIVATPHYLDFHGAPDANQIRLLVAELNQTLENEDVPVKVLPGMEIRVLPELPELVTAGRVITLNEGRYLLVEFPRAQVPAGFDLLVRRLTHLGYGIVLAHPEKNLRIQSDPEYLNRLVSLPDSWDLIIQISADSLTGDAGRDAYNTARFLMQKGLAKVIATDAHSVVSRPPMLAAALAKAREMVGDARARQMVQDIPAAILQGDGFPRLEEPNPPKRWWNVFS